MLPEMSRHYPPPRSLSTSAAVRIILMPVVLGFLAFCNTGCFSVVKRMAKEAIGATSKVSPVPGTIQSNFQEHKGVKILPVQTELGTLIPGNFIATLPKFLNESLTKGEDAPFQGEAPILMIEPQVMWFLHGGGVMGIDGFAVVLFRLSDDTGALGKVEVVTKSAASHTDAEDLAKNMAKKLAEWFRDRQKGKKLKEKPAEKEKTNEPDNEPRKSRA